MLNICCVKSVDGAVGAAPSGRDYIFTSMPYGGVPEHEVGHYFSLEHTFLGHASSNPELVNGSNCTTRGDLICDTPADPLFDREDIEITQNTILGHPGLGVTCSYVGTHLESGTNQPYNPPIHNYMAYHNNDCRSEFTPGQYAWIRYSAIHEHSNLECNCGTNDYNQWDLTI